MSLQTSSRTKPVEGFLSSLMESHPEASMRDIAVLFTDVVGSTKYFKKYGDIKGRAMLRKHHTMAISIVEEYGGSLIKEVGDSVMVYFPDAANAVKASVKMQHRFAAYNKEANAQHEIHVRVGIHFGKVIVEERDIYGDVVNVAAKLTNLANGDQLFVSEEVYRLTKGLPNVNFELMNFWTFKNVPAGLTIYKVIWESAPILQPDKVSILYLCPVGVNHTIETPDPYRTLWDNFLEQKERLTQKRHDTEHHLPDKNILLTYKDSGTALDVAEKLFAYFSSETKRISPTASVPLYMVLTRDTHPREIRLPIDKSSLSPEGLGQGNIYVTKVFHDDIKKQKEIPLNPKPDKSPETPFYRYILDNKPPQPQGQQPQTANPSPRGNRDGLFPPCFYCGEKNHLGRDCPSKLLTEPSHSIDEVGYLPPSVINRISPSMRTEPSQPTDGTGLSSVKEEELRNVCLYELNSVNQLRLFRAIWGSRSSEWEKAKRHRTESEGGFAWLALDSFRVSNHERAETYLRSAIEQDKKDYRAHCIAAFLNVERADYQAALGDLETAFLYAKLNPQKIFIHFFQHRIHMLLGDTQKAQDRLSKILYLDPTCPEAIYRDIILKLRQTKDKYALQRLSKLIAADRTYYVISIIDEEMARFGDLVDKELLRIFEDAKNNALLSLEEARTTYASMHARLRAKDIEEIEPIMAKMAQLLDSNSYYGYSDIRDLGSTVAAICNNALRNQKKDLSNRIESLRKRLERHVAFIKVYHYPQFSSSASRTLTYLMARMNEIEYANDFFSSWQFDDCHKQCDLISQELSLIEPKLSRLDILQQSISMSFTFLKNSSILFSIVFFLGIFIFPFIADHLSSLLAGLDIATPSNVWSFQKSFLIVGGIVSLLVSFFITARKAMKEQTYSAR